MIQEEILEYNKNCLEFLGYKCVTPEDKDFRIYEGKNKNLPNMIDANFNDGFLNNWNWIMEVIKFIESLRLEVPGYFVVDYYIINSGHNYCTISSGLKHADGETVSPHFYEKTAIGKDKKEAVIQAINKFLIWHKQNNKKKK